MPFGISTAPEIFQQRMHELVKGLRGLEVVADDFVAVGQGNIGKVAAKGHDKNLKTDAKAKNQIQYQ